MAESLWRKAYSRRPLASRENQRWTDEGAEPEEMPTWAGCGTERESGGRRHTNATMYLARWNRHRKTVAGTGALRRSKRENARPRAESVAHAKLSVDCGDGRRAEPFREMTTPAAECQIVLVQNRGIITNEFKTEASAGEGVGVEHRRGVDLLQGTKHWTGGRGGRHESRGSQHWGRQERVGE